MRTDINNYLEELIYLKCQAPTNKFGMGCYYHIVAVAKNAELLAEKYGADKEIVIIAAWLHDIASITDYSLYEQHHIYVADMANEILTNLDYNKSKIEVVKEFVRNHRGSICNNKRTVEETCVSDADAISHFDNVPSLLYLAYVTRGMEFNEGKEFVRGKLVRSLKKLSD